MEDPSFSAHDTDRFTMCRFRAADAMTLATYRSDPEVARYQDWVTWLGTCRGTKIAYLPIPD